MCKCLSLRGAFSLLFHAGIFPADLRCCPDYHRVYHHICYISKPYPTLPPWDDWYSRHGPLVTASSQRNSVSYTQHMYTPTLRYMHVRTLRYMHVPTLRYTDAPILRLCCSALDNLHIIDSACFVVFYVFVILHSCVCICVCLCVSITKPFLPCPPHSRPRVKRERKKKSTYRIFWEYYHKISGVFTIILGFLQVTLGLFLVIPPVAVWAVWIAIFGLWVLAILLHEIVKWIRYFVDRKNKSKRQQTEFSMKTF